jgi:hypothetical protein
MNEQFLSNEPSEKEVKDFKEYIRIYIDLIELQRLELHKLRDNPAHNPDVIRNMEAQMDLEEEKLKIQLRSHREI